MSDTEISARLQRVMQRMQADGRADRFFDAEYPTDEKLWVEAHNVDPQLFAGTLQEANHNAEDPVDVAVIDDWVQQLRNHYDQGRRPRQLNMAMLARALRAAGVTVHLVHQGANSYVLNVGPAADFDGAQQAAVVCGPVQRIKGRTVGLIGTFTVGPADQPAGPAGPGVTGSLLDPDRPWRVCEVVPVVLMRLDAQLARRGHDGAAIRAHTLLLRRRIDAAVQQATEAFWAAVGHAFPEVTTGDADPLEILRLEQLMTGAVASWLAENQPSGLWTAPHQSSPTATPAGTETLRPDQEAGANAR